MYDIFSSKVIPDYFIFLSAMKDEEMTRNEKHLHYSHFRREGRRCQVTTMPKENWASSNFKTQLFI
jgi:hypothetical protein